MADASWVDAYPLSFLPSLAQLSSIDRQPQASSRVPRPASQAPPSPLEPPLPRPKSPVRDARLRKKRPLDSREVGGRNEAVQRPRKRVERGESRGAATSDGGTAATSLASPRKGRRGRSRADSGASGEAARSTHWEHDRHPRPANARDGRSASMEACHHVSTRQSEKERRWAVRPLMYGGRSDETQFAARNLQGVNSLDDLSAVNSEPVTSTAHAAPTPRVTLAVKGAAARSSPAAAVVAVSPRSPSILPEPTPRALTEFSPPADHLSLAHFAKLLLDRPTEPTWSNPLYDSLLSFFTACADPACWTSRPDDLLPKTKQFHLSAYLTSHQPNKSEIQAAHRPSPESGFDTLSSRLQAKVSAMSDVMRWLWEDSSLTVSHVCGLVRHAPLSIFFLGAFGSPLFLCSSFQLTDRAAQSASTAALSA